MTETNMILSNPYHGERRAGSVGLPLPGVEVQILPEEGTESSASTGTAPFLSDQHLLSRKDHLNMLGLMCVSYQEMMLKAGVPHSEIFLSISTPTSPEATCSCLRHVSS